MMKKRRIIPVGPHRKHPGASRISAPLFQLASAEDHVAVPEKAKRKVKIK